LVSTLFLFTAADGPATAVFYLMLPVGNTHFGAGMLTSSEYLTVYFYFWSAS
jgi:hypothetical protein